MAAAGGGSMNGKRPGSPKRRLIICRMTSARLARWISGTVKGSRDWKSSSVYRRTQMPGPVRPQRPRRCSQLACETRLTRRLVVPVRGL